MDFNNRTKSARCAANVSPLCFFDLYCSWLLFVSHHNVDVWLASMQISWIITSSASGQTQIKPTSYELNNDVMFYFKIDFNALLLWKEFYTQVQCVNKCTVSCFLRHLLLRSCSLEQISIPHSWASNLALEVARVMLVGIWWCSAVPLVESCVLSGHQKLQRCSLLQDVRNLVPFDFGPCWKQSRRTPQEWC